MKKKDEKRPCARERGRNVARERNLGVAARAARYTYILCADAFCGHIRHVCVARIIPSAVRRKMNGSTPYIRSPLRLALFPLPLVAPGNLSLPFPGGRAHVQERERRAFHKPPAFALRRYDVELQRKSVYVSARISSAHQR